MNGHFINNLSSINNVSIEVLKVRLSKKSKSKVRFSFMVKNLRLVYFFSLPVVCVDSLRPQCE